MVVLVRAEARVADALPSAMEVAASEEDCVSAAVDESGYGTTTTTATAGATAPATSAGTASPSDSGSDEKDASAARARACADQDSTFLLEKDVLDMLKLSYILQVRFPIETCVLKLLLADHRIYVPIGAV
jgi:hypothetical protein